MIRIRNSYLEAFRRVIATEYGREDELIAAIKGVPFPANWMMDAGTAWHEILSCDNLPTRLLGCGSEYRLRQGKYSFRVDAILDALDHIGMGVWEVPGAVQILPGVSLEGKADHIRGIVVQDQKTKFSPADAKDYEASMQWRSYILIHRAHCFRYNLFSFADPDASGYCEFKGVLSFKFWRYATLEDDVRTLVQQFLDWAESRGLLGCLERDPYATQAA